MPASSVVVILDSEPGFSDRRNRQDARQKGPFGLPDALHDVSWPRMGEAEVLANVDEFVHDIRGEIVHRGTTPGPFHKGGVKSWINFFDGLVSRLDKKIGTHLEMQTGTAPW